MNTIQNWFIVIPVAICFLSWSLFGLLLSLETRKRIKNLFPDDQVDDDENDDKDPADYWKKYDS